MGIWGQYVTPEPRFSGLVLDHQGFQKLELKNSPKIAIFDQIWLFLRLFGSGFFKKLMVEHQAPNSGFWSHILTPRYQWVP